MEVQFGAPTDIDSWMDLVEEVKWNFPGLETETAIEEHKSTVMEFISQRRALCVKDQNIIVGVLLFSRKYNMICCLAVKPEYRKRGIASMLMKKALSELDGDKDIVVSTFREGDEKGIAARAFYKKFGFVEGELTEEFGSPCQVFTLFR
ncbi:MAG: GNAT family N-acetyltransferase [Christensenellales bacterium]|jgi:ribosomal protein S18 acetylase RimI-like enzyme